MPEPQSVERPQAARGEATAPTGAGDDLGAALLAVFRAYVEGTKGVCADLPGGTKGFHVLAAVAGQPCRNQASIADSLRVDRTVMTHTIDELEGAGLVERRPDPRDRRARQIVITGAGQQRLEVGAAALSEVERRMLQVLDEEEAAAFRSLMRRVAEAAASGGCDGGCPSVDPDRAPDQP